VNGVLKIEELRNALQYAKDYREITIPKKRGGWRTIMIPSPELKKVQRKILRFLQRMYILHDSSVFGLRSGSYIKHAKFHADSRWLFTFDLKDAFPSVGKQRLRILLRKTFRESLIPLKQEWPDDRIEEFICLITELTTYNDTLPQGAPTSPLLFFLVIEESRLITKLFYASQPMKISCYVDGFVISGSRPPSVRTKKAIFKCLEGSGFEANFKKTRQFDCHQGAPLVVGLRINGTEKRISLPKRTTMAWRGIIHRAAMTTDPCEKTDLFLKIQGFISSLKPIYPEKLPPQIAKPYLLFLQSLKGIPIEKKKSSVTKPLTEENKISQEKTQIKQKQTCLIDWL
jgi:hypothetical protein